MLTRRHYENFSVASRFVDGRRAARSGAHLRVLPNHRRSRRREPRRQPRCRGWSAGAAKSRRSLRGIAAGASGALRAARDRSRAANIPAQPFLDLIAANVQDQHVKRYRTWDELDRLLPALGRAGRPHGAAASSALTARSASGSPTTSASGCSWPITRKTSAATPPSAEAILWIATSTARGIAGAAASAWCERARDAAGLGRGARSGASRGRCACSSRSTGWAGLAICDAIAARRLSDASTSARAFRRPRRYRSWSAPHYETLFARPRQRR